MSRKLRLWPKNRSRKRNFLLKYSRWSNKGKLLWSTLEIAEMKDEKIDTFALLIQQTQKTAWLISPVAAFGSRFKNRNSIFPRRTPIQIRFIANLLIKFFLGIKQVWVGPYPAVRPVALNPAFFSDPVGT